MNKVIVVLYLILIYYIIQIIVDFYHKKKIKNFVFKPKCEIQNHTMAENYLKNIYTQKIPFTIYQTGKKNTVSLPVYNAIMNTIAVNSEYDHYFYDDSLCIKFLEDNFEPRVLSAYKKLVPGAYKADLFRYCILYINGGVYCDDKFTFILPLRKFIPEDSDFVIFRDIFTGSLQNGFIACTPRNPILKKAIELCIFNIETNNYGESDLDVTGPQLLGRAFNFVIKNKSEIDKKRYILNDLNIDIIGDLKSSDYKVASKQRYLVVDKLKLTNENNVPVICKTAPDYYKHIGIRNRYGFLYMNKAIFRKQ